MHIPEHNVYRKSLVVTESVVHLLVDETTGWALAKLKEGGKK